MKQTTSKLASRQFHQWLIPEKTVMGMFSLGVILIFIGAILLAVASVTSGALAIIGGIFLGIGLVLVFICLGLCTYSWCVWYVRDQETQTIQTTLVGIDQPDGDWQQMGFDGAEKKVPNGVLRDGRATSGSLSKKHVTISPRSHDTISSGSGRHGDTLLSSDYSKGGKSGPGSVTSDMSTLASFAYLHDPTLSSPYNTIDNRQQGHRVHVQSEGQGHSNVRQIPINVQSNYDYSSVPRSNVDGSSRAALIRPYHGEQSTHSAQSARSNVLPVRRHSDDDYDNANDMTPMLPYQTYQPASPTPSQPWTHQQQQQHQLHQQQQQQQHQQRYQHQQQQNQQQGQWQHSWQQNQPPQQQTVWQYQRHGTSGGGGQTSQSGWRQNNPPVDEPPPPQPLVYPSARRPMTFEQMSSSKVSLYDNIHMSRRDEEE